MLIIASTKQAPKNRIAMLRTLMGLSQAQLAKKTGLSRQAISLYEIGKREPKLETWQRLSDFFRVSVSYLQGIQTEKVLNENSKIMLSLSELEYCLNSIPPEENRSEISYEALSTINEFISIFLNLTPDSYNSKLENEASLRIFQQLHLLSGQLSDSSADIVLNRTKSALPKSNLDSLLHFSYKLQEILKKYKDLENVSNNEKD